MGKHGVRAWRRRIFLAGLILAVSGVHEHALASTPSPLGQWERADGGTKIDITKCGRDFCAVNIWVRDPNGAEKVGDRLEMALAPTASPGILKGPAYDVRRKMHYRMTMTLAGGTMRTRGCVLFGVICKTAQWNRVN
ncbi:MAG: DUF2147 domain-containing protein [Rhodospirillales bacterium]|nr:DUF2147 domain-containing protein [Rhodospirillales bacterium]